MTLPARSLVALLRLYKQGSSPGRGPRCRWYPSCSTYAIEAIEIHGAIRGTYLAIRRLLRCHPLRKGGYDEVPARFNVSASRTHGTVPGGRA